jgi:putative membrane protein
MTEANVERSLIKGILAGMIAGLVATAAKVVSEKMYAPTSGREVEGREATASLYRSDEPNSQANIFAEADWALGLAAGAAYGALTEFYPSAASGAGKTFGLALMTLTHATALPSADTEATMDADQEYEPDQQETSEAASHLVFGTVAEQVRSYVRAIL